MILQIQILLKKSIKTINNDYIKKEQDKFELNNKIYNILDKNNYFDSEYIIKTGTYSLNKIINKKYSDTIDIIVCMNRYDNEYKKILEIFQKDFIKNKLKINKINLIKNNKFILYYFQDLYEVYYKDTKIITFYIMREPYILNYDLKQSNFHTTVFILLYKYLLNNNIYYLYLAELLLNKSNNKNLLNHTNFKSYQNTFTKDCMKDILYNKNKLIFNI